MAADREIVMSRRTLRQQLLGAELVDLSDLANFLGPGKRLIGFPRVNGGLRLPELSRDVRLRLPLALAGMSHSLTDSHSQQIDETDVSRKLPYRSN